MRPLLHPTLVNGRTGDPALYIETLYEKHTVLFDLGDLSVLPPRKVHRLRHVFVSHTHIDHFVGFDYLLRILVGREKKLNLYGPADFIDQIGHKLHAYRWNLFDRYSSDLVFRVTEIFPSLETRTAHFSLKNGFAMEEVCGGRAADGVVHAEPAFRVQTAVLDHGTPCLAFAIQEAAHFNVWKNRLMEWDLPVGPWLKDLKRAIVEERPDDHMIAVGPAQDAGNPKMPLEKLRDLVTITPGQKIGYVTDAADTPANRAAIISLVRNADLLFIEAHFARGDAPLAADRAHLTTAAAGSIAREARAGRVEPFHFSSRYAGEEARLMAEVLSAFSAGKV